MERRHQSDVRPTCSADSTNSKPFIRRADRFKLISVYSSLLLYSVAFQLKEDSMAQPPHTHTHTHRYTKAFVPTATTNTHSVVPFGLGT